MTDSIISGLVVVVVVVAVIWARARSARSDRRSMESYGHGLAALGDITKRTVPSSSVRAVPRADAGRTQVRTDIVTLGKDATIEPEGGEQGAGEQGEHPAQATGLPDGRATSSEGRKVTVAVVAGLAVLLIVAAAVLLTGGTPTAKSVPNKHRRLPPASSSTSTTSIPRKTTAVVRPISTSGTDATFKMPSRHYRLAFSGVSGACWIGIAPSLGASGLLWSETVQNGSTLTYLASGPVAVELGAPEYASVKVNGAHVAIPKGVTVYNLVFVS